ncbi:phosphopantetheine-binding protein [Streptomyces galbus]|uniref:Uncharacterized protein n=1 Tax=Streptomyces galbus TaxID=33898 RepID=A0A4U5W669_STRGB|nr:phosphopantetheine-binding protein [Streptomyces galbus]TKS96759.1 hypothetical protein E4U92_34295 [Streptomyces galbus]GHD54297.1 hypothetical protein GCM10010335_68570 [Streptomyces galbus]
MISKDDLRTILIENAGLGPAEELTDGAELVIDSFTLVILQHVLEERYGVVIDPQFDEMAQFTSIDGIHTYVTRAMQEH